MINLIQKYKDYKADVQTFTKLVEDNKEALTFRRKYLLDPNGAQIVMSKSYQIRKPGFYLSSYKNEASCYDNGGGYTLICSIPVGHHQANHLINTLLAEKVFKLCNSIYTEKQR